MPEQARQSFSTNMMPDWSDERDTITRIARRKFAFAREVGDYTSLTLTLTLTVTRNNPNPNPDPKPNPHPNPNPSQGTPGCMTWTRMMKSG